MRNPKNTTGSRLIVDSTNFTYEALKKVNENLGLTEGTASEGNNKSNPYALGATSWTDANGVVVDSKLGEGRVGSIADNSQAANYGLSRSDGIYGQQVKAVTETTGEHLANSFSSDERNKASE